MNVDPGIVIKLDLKPGDTMVVSIDLGTLPSSRAREYMERVANLWRTVIPDKAINIMVIPNSTNITILGPGMITQNTSPANPQDAYDHAMGIVP